MTVRGRVRIALVIGLGLLAAAVALRRASHGSAPGRKPPRPALKKVASRPPKMSPAPPVLDPEAARQARAESIRRSIEELRDECRQAAAGDWDRWTDSVEPARAELRVKIEACRPLHPEATGDFEGRSAVLEGKDGFPLFEPAPQVYLNHILEPHKVESAFDHGRSVIAATRWLRERGIDVLFVTVPKMTEVYPEHFLDHVPADGVLAPQIRRVVLELLEADVEAIDLLHDLRRERDTGDGPLYQPADPHWTPRAQAIAARRIAERMLRYDFVARAQARPPTCLWGPSPYRPASEGAAFGALHPDQQRRAIEAQPKMAPFPRDCTGSLYDDEAPVVCIGDSYNAGFTDHLARELNVPVRNLSGGGFTTQRFRDFLRDPGLLRGARVVVWTVCYTNLEGPWTLPRPIAGPPRGPVEEPAK